MTAAIAEGGTHFTLIRIDKFAGDWFEGAVPYETIEIDGNMLLGGGVSSMWQQAIGNGSTVAGGSLTYFNNANAAIGVGDGSAAEAVTQNNLQGTNRVRKAMDASYPQHSDGTTGAAQTITFRSTFQTNEANFTWAEAGVFNSATDGTGRMLNRKAQAMGTKTAASAWQVTFTISIT